MKTQKIISLGFFFALFAVMVYGQKGENFFVSVTEGENPKAIAVQMAGLDGARTHLHLMDYRGVTVYSDYRWGDDAYAAHFLLEGMEPGDYLLHIKNRHGQKVQPVHLTDNSVILFEYHAFRELPSRPRVSSYADREGRLIARFTAKEGKPVLQVQMANLKYEPATLYLASLAGIPVWEENLRGEYAYAKNINLEGVAEGDYYFYVKTPETSLWQMFKLGKEGLELKQRFFRDNVIVGSEGPVITAE